MWFGLWFNMVSELEVLGSKFGSASFSNYLIFHVLSFVPWISSSHFCSSVGLCFVSFIHTLFCPHMKNAVKVWTFDIEWFELWFKIMIFSSLPDKLVLMHVSSSELTCKNFLTTLGIAWNVLRKVKFIWKSFLPSLRSILCWRILQGLIPTDDKFIHLGYSFCLCCSL